MPNCLVSLHHCERIQQEFFKMALGCRACWSTAEVWGEELMLSFEWHILFSVQNVLSLNVYATCMHTSTSSLTFPSSVHRCMYSLPGHGPHQHALRAPHGRLWGLLHCSAHPAANLRCLLEVPPPLVLFFPLPRSTLAYASPYTYPFAESARLILSTSRAPAITLKCNLRVSFVTARTTMSYKCFKCSRRGGFWCTGRGRDD